MNLSGQCVSLELAKKLKELGIYQDSYFFYEYYSDSSYRLSNPYDCFNSSGGERFSAFNVAELIEMLPASIGNWDLEIYKFKNGYTMDYLCNTWNKSVQAEQSLANCCAKMLIYLVENKLVELDK